jgi:dTDP-4-amino-4,6-dideoxygalactose transaminase
MDNLQAAVGNIKFKYLASNLLRRAQIAKMYDEAFASLPITLPRQREGRVYQDYIIKFNTKFERDNAYDHLARMQIETMKNEYPMPIQKLPIAKEYEETTLRIPCNDVLEDDEVGAVITGVKSLFS